MRDKLRDIAIIINDRQIIHDVTEADLLKGLAIYQCIRTVYDREVKLGCFLWMAY